MGNRKRIVVAVVFILFMFCFITFAGGTPQNQAIATRNVTFIDSYNNAEISAQRIIVGEDAEVPEDPRHAQLVFTGWYLEGDRDVRITNFTNITENLKVVALYGADRNRNGIVDDDDERYTVTFRDSIDNRIIATREVLAGMDAVPPTAPTHTGLTFTGWDSSYSNVRSNIEVNAVYRTTPVVSVNRYTVTFKDGLDDKVIATVEVEEGLTANAPEAPTHEGYVFVRWEGDLDNITRDSEITGIYAVDSNGNGEADDTETRYTVSYTSLIEGTRNEAPRYERSFLTREGYTVLENTFALDGAIFLGWTLDEDSAKTVVKTKEEAENIALVKVGTRETIESTNVVYYAVWAMNVNGNDVPDHEETHVLTINYVYRKDGKVAAETYKEEVVYNMDYSVTSPSIEKYTASEETVSGTMPNKDVTVRVVYSATNDTNNNDTPDEDETYNLTINYVYDIDGSVAADTHTERFVYNMPYEITSPAIEKYTADKTVIKGDMPNEDLTITVTYKATNDVNFNKIPDEEETYTFTIDYVYALDGSKAAESYTEEIVYDMPYAVTSPVIAKYTADKTVVKGTMPNGPLTVTVTYDATNDENGDHIPDEDEIYDLTILYVYDRDGKEAAPTHTEKVLFGTEYEVTSPIVEKYTASEETVSGTMPNESHTVTVTYNATNDINDNGIPDEDETHNLTINYVDKNGNKLATSYKDTVVYNMPYEVDSPSIPKYKTLDTKVTGTMPNADETIDVLYTPVNDENNNGIPDEDETYTLSIEYVYADGSPATDTVTEDIVYNMPYNVTSPVIAKYAADKTVVKGNMPNNNLTIKVTYTKIEYTVSFYSNGRELTSTKVEQDGHITNVPNAELSGYEFLGWSKDSDQTRTYSEEEVKNLTVTANVNFQAAYREIIPQLTGIVVEHGVLEFYENTTTITGVKNILTVYAIYDDGSRKVITNYSITGFDGVIPGTRTMTVSYEGYTKDLQYIIKPVGSSIGLTMGNFEPWNKEGSFKVAENSGYKINTIKYAEGEHSIAYFHSNGIESSSTNSMNQLGTLNDNSVYTIYLKGTNSKGETLEEITYVKKETWK